MDIIRFTFKDLEAAARACMRFQRILKDGDGEAVRGLEASQTELHYLHRPQQLALGKTRFDCVSLNATAHRRACPCPVDRLV